MPNFSLLFAHSLQDADHVACVVWKWDKVGELGHDQYRRPDNGELVRFAPDNGGQSLRGLRWNTKIYLTERWRQRHDASQIMGMLDSGFFDEGDPTLPPPKSRKSRDADTLSELRRTLTRLEQRK